MKWLRCITLVAKLELATSESRELSEELEDRERNNAIT